MPGETEAKERKEFFTNVPQVRTDEFFLKGSGNLDWGMKSRLARIFSPKSGKAVMLAFDHGYIYGPTTGLERVDQTILPLIPYIDVLMCTRGVLRACVPPTAGKPVCLRVSAGASILKDMSHECVGVAVEDAVRLDAAAMAVQVYIGGEHEHDTIRNLTQVIDAGNRAGIATLGVTAVGREMARDARYLGLATRIIAELGANFVKTYYCAEDFEDVVAGCPIPIVIAGGKKLPELDCLAMCRGAIDAGALGVDMGRNIFQADDPIAMARAVGAVVHEGLKAKQGLKMYETLKSENKAKAGKSRKR
jgi:putative autoinducer-2 (AI-2) aldolase